MSAGNAEGPFFDKLVAFLVTLILAVFGAWFLYITRFL